MSRARPVSVCYVPGLDLRRIEPGTTPFMHAALQRFAWARIETMPITELVPSLLTGVGPEQHGFWQMKLHPDARRRRRRVWDLVPDPITTTLQCFLHLLHPSYDLAAIPARRRRRFELTRFKYTRRQHSAEVIANIGGYPSVIGLLGPERARYFLSRRLEELDRVAERLTEGPEALILAEVYGLDLFQHWSLDRPDVLRSAYARIDAFVADVDRRAQAQDRLLVLLVDHGQELVKGTIDLRRRLRGLGIPEAEYTYFLDVPMARFWFHTDRARDAITAMLRSVPHGRTLHYSELAEYHVAFRTPEYGEVYFAADPDHILFPHDFYHPLANLFLGLRDWHQRPRTWNPRHRGTHGHLPGAESERGFLAVLDPRAEPTTSLMQLIDVAPTLLALTGNPIPEHMQGRPALRLTTAPARLA